ncbi:helix-turn-helix domain-containing protein [Klebsiella pneumoniae]
MKGFNIMTLISSTRFFNGALLAGAMALISTEVAVAQPAPGTADSSGRLVQTWDKTFPRSEKVDHQKVTFKNRYGITLAADVYLPKDRGNKKLAALVISGPFGAVKEQASGLYAQTLAERGFVTLAFDPSYTGESSGEPRNIASPDINTEDFMAAVDFMGLQPYVDRERIGVIGICGMGGIALNAVAVDKRVKAVVASTMYDMSRVMSKGFSLARDIAQDFVMYLRRPGGQLQFSRYNLQQTATQGPINDLLAWLLENLTADLSVDKLAEKVAMSPRNFTRVFTRETGASPARYVAEARLAAARQRLEQTHETLDRIAEQTGFGSSINLRRLFEKQLNLTPGEYRQRFHCRKMA